MHTHRYSHKHAYITTRVHIYIFAPECVCCIKSFTVKQRKYSINSSIISSAIRDQHYANLIVKIWQNIKTNNTDMHTDIYMRRKVCHSDRIAITCRTGGCRVDSPQYGQQYMVLCRHRLFSPNFALLKKLYIWICPMHSEQEGRH